MGKQEEGEEEEEVEEKGRREVAIVSTQSLQPNFNPIRGVTQDQLSKLRELRGRRLKIKSKTKIHKKSKGPADGTNESHSKGLNNQGCVDMDSSAPIEESSVPKLATNLNRHSYSAQKDGATPEIEPKKRKKLHWGLDTRERWERKANM